jgi:hypothetical protein
MSIMHHCRFQAASRKFRTIGRLSKGAKSKELKARVEQYESSKAETHQPREVPAALRASSRNIIDDRVENAALRLQGATAELTEALKASGARASPAVVKVMEGSIAAMTQLLSNGW